MNNTKKLFLFLWAFFMIFLIWFFIKSIDKVNATTRTLYWWTVTRDNNNFINQEFWAGDPSDEDIIKALYGSGSEGSAYTRNWDSNSCNQWSMTVTEIGTLPATLSANTVYILTGEQIIQNSYITMASCSAIISKNITGTTIYSSTTINSSYWMLYAYYKENIILDNISIDGEANWSWSPHNKNRRWIWLYNSDNNTIHKVKSFNHEYYWIHLSYGADYNTISHAETYNNNYYWIYFEYWDSSTYYNEILNSNIYNNRYGIYITSDNNNINNSQVYNNTSYWLFIDWSWNNAINNSLFYNNDSDGIHISTSLTAKNTINNSHIFNNASYGLYISSPGNVINNTKIYNNTNWSYVLSSTNKYYWVNHVFENGANNNLSSATAWSSSDYPTLLRNNGSLITNWTLSLDIITNPLNSNGNYLLNWLDTWTSLRGRKTSYTWTTTAVSYGSGIATQLQPVRWIGTDTITWTYDYTTGYFIWSDLAKTTGELEWLYTPISWTWISLTWTAFWSSLIDTYNIFWNVVTNIWNIIDSQVDIEFTAGYGNKKLITQLYGPEYAFIHWENAVTTFRELNCTAGWDNENFINQDFWDNYYGWNTDEIICALYGTWPGSTTAYTNHRTWRDTTQCSGADINIVLTGKLSVWTLPWNTIYVLTNSISTWTNTSITLNSCSAVISMISGGTTFYSTTQIPSSALFTTSDKTHIIFDNISVNWSGDGIWGSHMPNLNWLYIQKTSNTTLNNIYVYNNDDVGVYLKNSTHNKTTNTKLYNNNYGLYIYGWSLNYFYDIDSFGNKYWVFGHHTAKNYFNNLNIYNNDDGLYFFSTESCNIENSQFYNNDWDWIFFQTNTSWNSINNTQVYNNYDWVSFTLDSSNNIINNIQVYNNSDFWLYIQNSAINNISNNIHSYNNKYWLWIALATDIKYYGELILRNNDINFGWNGSLIQWSWLDSIVALLWRNTGDLKTGNSLSWNFITNPRDTLWNYLLSWSTDIVSLRWSQNAYTGSVTTDYSYWADILPQTQPVVRSWLQIVATWSFDDTKYIWSDVQKISWELLWIDNAVNQTWFTVTWTTTFIPLISHYNIYGNILSNILWQTINTQTNIELSAWSWTKRIITQLYNPNSNPYFATHFEKKTILDQDPPSQVILISPSSWSLFTTWNISLVRSAAIDTWVVISGYYFEVMSWSSAVESGFISTTWTNITLPSGTYTRRVYAIDNVWNTWMWSNVWNFTIELCGNWVLDIGEQCDGEVGCSSSCAREEVSCLLDLISPIYSGESTIITWIVNNWRTIVIWINFGLPDYKYSIWLSWNYIAGHTYSSGWIFEIQMDVVHPWSWGIISICTWNIEVQYCGDWDINGWEQCDLGSENGPNSACSSSCTWNIPSCTIEPINTTIYSGAEITITWNAISGARFTGINFWLPDTFFSINKTWIYVTWHTYSSWWTFVITWTVDNPISGSMINYCTWSVAVEYCGDWIINGDEQCDGQSWCFSSCTRENVFCSLDSPASIYSGEFATITWTVNSWRTIVSGFNFGLPNYSYSIWLFWNYSTGQTYNSWGIYQITMDVVHPWSGDIVYSCTWNIEVQYCGDGIVNGGEDCDGSSWCNSICEFEVPPTYTCNLPWWWSINSWDSVIAYQSNNVPCWSTCTSQIRTCVSSGNLDWSFVYQNCSVLSCWGGGWWSFVIKDNCKSPGSNLACSNDEWIDYSPSYYDDTCCSAEPHWSALLCDVSDSTYSQEITESFSWAYTNNITNKCPISRALLDNNITRAEAAKMVSMFAIQIMWLKPDEDKIECNNFDDIDSLSTDLNYLVKLSCKLDIMWLHSDWETPKDSFDPYDYVDRAQFGTILSRMIYKDENNIKSGEENIYNWYEKHLNALKDDGVMTKIENPNMLEKRSWVILMLHRTYGNGLTERYWLLRAALNWIEALLKNIW
jgi:hypothetical protein